MTENTCGRTSVKQLTSGSKSEENRLTQLSFHLSNKVLFSSLNELVITFVTKNRKKKIEKHLIMN